MLTEWQGADIREKGILLLVFTPMLICVLGLIFSVTSFVLFVLPAFVLRVLGWGVLTALFGAGGIYCHDRLKGRDTPQCADRDCYDVRRDTFDSTASPWEEALSSQREERPAWFENVRKMRWKE